MANWFTVFSHFYDISSCRCLGSDRVIVDLVMMTRGLLSEPATVIYEFSFLRGLDRPILRLEIRYFIGAWSRQLQLFLLQYVINIRCFCTRKPFARMPGAISI